KVEGGGERGNADRKPGRGVGAEYAQAKGGEHEHQQESRSGVDGAGAERGPGSHERERTAHQGDQRAERLENRAEAASLRRVGPRDTRCRGSRYPLAGLESQARAGVEHETIAGSKRQRLPGAQLPLAESSRLDDAIGRSTQRRDTVALGDIERNLFGKRTPIGDRGPSFVGRARGPRRGFV